MVTNLEIRSTLMVPTYSLQGTNLILVYFTLWHFLVKYKIKLKDNPSMIWCYRGKLPFQVQTGQNGNANT